MSAKRPNEEIKNKLRSSSKYKLFNLHARALTRIEVSTRMLIAVQLQRH